MSISPLREMGAAASAESIIESCRRLHNELVFSHMGCAGSRLDRIMDSVAGRAMNAMDMLKEVAAALPGIQVPEALNAVNDLGISFPEIAVVGQESTGKSSVLERITMLPLFPRGVDIVTRSAYFPMHAVFQSRHIAKRI